MKDDQYDLNRTNEEPPPEWLIEALSDLPSEKARPTPEGDEAIMNLARGKLAPLRQQSFSPLFLPILAAAACVALAVLSFTNSVPPSTAPDPLVVKEDSAAVILREVTLLFPDQVRAIVHDKGRIEVDLLEGPPARKGPAVVLELNDRGEMQQIITYIGQTIKIRGRSVTILMGAHGQILIEGTGISWSSDHPAQPLLNLNIRTRLI